MSEGFRGIRGPRHRFTFRGVDFASYRWNRWEASRGGLGSAGRTPLTAWLHLRRWEKEYRNAPPGRWAHE